MSDLALQPMRVIVCSPSVEGVNQSIGGTVRFLQRGYYLWMAVYIVLGITSIGLPTLAAMGVADGRINQVLAGFGALAAAIFGFLKPNEYATSFDSATQLAWSTQINFEHGEINRIQAAEALERAVTMTTFRYNQSAPSVIHAHSALKPIQTSPTP